ncbi:MAG: selenocysteine lyase/cysteine desulfurase [Chlamydiales bacterium]|jgi:selenocysteine lyase/cysteine desulfurase
MNKRTFLKQMSLVGLGASPLLAYIERLVHALGEAPDTEVAEDEDFWAKIRAGYRLKSDYINLENGYYCMMPEETLERYVAHVREVNHQASYYMRTVQSENRRRMVAMLAETANCSPDNLVITRNTTESLDLVIGGLPWKAGDEAVMAEQDYGAMLDMFRLQAERHGIVNRIVSIPNDPRDDDEIVDLYASAITDRTRVLMVCHMINITGQVLPVRKICDMAHARGVEVMVDGAHAFAHIESDIPALGADYYGASLHKWLGAPLGCGILWVKPDKVEQLWPLFAESGRPRDEMSRLNHTGTKPVHVELGIADALAYHDRLGPSRKQARLRYLQTYWTSQVRELARVRINTPRDPMRACAIANVGIEGIEPSELAGRLLKEHHIWTVAINRPGVRGCRITPNIYTTVAELDVFVAALRQIAGA